MKSPYKKIIVFDLETGGFYPKHQSITEIAMVAIDLETLEIIDEVSTMILPYLDFEHSLSDPIKEAKAIVKAIGEKDEDTNIKTVIFDGEKVTLKNVQNMADHIEEFNNEIRNNMETDIMCQDQMIHARDDGHGEVIDLYLKYKYNPQALEATHIPMELIEKEGRDHQYTHLLCCDFIKKHTVGNSKPILAGHNIKEFDMPFMDIFWKINDDDIYKLVNKKFIDTLEEARIKWHELTDFTLSTCAAEVGLTFKNAHRALPDTVANAKLLIKMLQHLRGEGSQASKYKRRKYSFNF